MLMLCASSVEQMTARLIRALARSSRIHDPFCATRELTPTQVARQLIRDDLRSHGAEDDTRHSAAVKAVRQSMPISRLVTPVSMPPSKQQADTALLRKRP